MLASSKSVEKANAESIIERGKETAEKAKKEREEKRDKLTAKDDLISNAGNLLISDKAAKEAWKLVFDRPIEILERHLNSVDQFKRQQRDNYARVLMTFDMTADYSSEEWEADVARHRERLEELKALKKAFEEGHVEDDKTDSEEGKKDGNGSDNSLDSPDTGAPVGSDSGGEELAEDNESGE